MKNFRNKGGSGKFDSGKRQMYLAVCSNCGNKCEVPFRPTGDKPVLCNDCFSTSRGRGSRASNKFDSGKRQMYLAVCSNCGNKCEVPFRPTGDKPVFCNNCYDKQGHGRQDSNKESKQQLEALNSKLDKILEILISTAGTKPVKPKVPAKKSVGKKIVVVKKTKSNKK